MWGEPRYGHPEGKIVLHIREVLDNVDKLDVDANTRRQLRLITFTHDAFKNIENKSRQSSHTQHHAVLATKFLEQFTDEKAILDIVELHDEAYYAWRAIFMYDIAEKGRFRMKNLVERIGENIQLYYLFFKCDTSTGDKNPAPLRWFEENMEGISIRDFR